MASADPGNKHEPLCISEEMLAAMHGWKRRHLAHVKKHTVKPEAGVPTDIFDASFRQTR